MITLARMKVKILLKERLFFLVMAERPKDPDSYRDCCDLEKKDFLKKIETFSWKWLLKNRLFYWVEKIVGIF